MTEHHKKEAELREELAFHLEAEAEERRAAGLSAEEALYAARRDLGNPSRVMEETRVAWGWAFVETLRQDLRFALRSLRKNRGFAALAVLILGLGIGANTAVFSVVNAVVLRPLEYRDAERIVALSTLWKKLGPGSPVSTPDFQDWHDQNKSFEAMAAYSAGERPVVAGAGASFGGTAAVTAEFFRVLGVEPVFGRGFSAEETKPGGSGAVLVSYGVWQTSYGGDPSVLGKTVRISGRSFPIVGVLPAGFRFPGDTDFWVPQSINPPNLNRSAHNLKVVAKLRPGFTVRQAQAEMTVIGDRLTKEYPRSNADKNVAVASLHDALVGDTGAMLYVLLGAVGVVLLIACGNVANLLLAKASVRGREIAVRAALGAGRGRIVRQLLTENLLLAMMAGAVGLLIAYGGAEILVSLAPGNVPRLADTGVDAWVLAFAFLATLGACLLFGLTPALRTARIDLNEALKQGSRSTSGTRSVLRRGLVAAEIALSVVLLAGAGLLVRSFAALHDVALGFRPDNVLVMETSFPSAFGSDTVRNATAAYKRLLAEAPSIPGIAAVGAARIPPGVVGSNGFYAIDSTPTIEQLSVTMPQAVYSIVAPGAFAALGIPVNQGRDFASADTFEAPRTAIVNEELVRRAFAGRNPLGHTIVTGMDSLDPMTIVGVVGDIRQYGPGRPPEPEVYMPYEQHPGPSTALRVLVRTTVPPEQVSEQLRRLAREIAPDMPVKFTTMEARMADNVAAPRFRTLLLAIFAVLAVGLAMAGVYGVISFMVNQRTNEIGLRMALGARAGDVMKMVFSQGASLAAIGLMVGLAGAAAATRLLNSMLFGVKATDPVTYGGVVALIVVVTIAATYVPARRAARVDPMRALRQE